MDTIHIQPGIDIPMHELWFTTSRSSGAGGQHVNTTDSRVSLHWSPDSSGALTPAQKGRVFRRLSSRITKDGVLQLHVESERSQHMNKDIAIERFAELIRQALVQQKRRVATKPSRGSVERRINAKKSIGEKKKLRKAPPV
jgi:ribosome-associated protein